MLLHASAVTVILLYALRIGIGVALVHEVTSWCRLLWILLYVFWIRIWLVRISLKLAWHVVTKGNVSQSIHERSLRVRLQLAWHIVTGDVSKAKASMNDPCGP